MLFALMAVTHSSQTLCDYHIKMHFIKLVRAVMIRGRMEEIHREGWQVQAGFHVRWGGQSCFNGSLAES